MAIKIAFYNHKGGVSKTTSVFHIGWKLAEMGCKVLLVDADSQCNLTLLALGIVQFEKYYKNNPLDNIKDALTPAFKAQTHLIKPVDCLTIRDNLYLLPGHIDLASYEIQLGFSFQLNSFGTMQNLPGSFSYLFDKTANKYSADYILIDLNPSISAINQDLVLSSDFFIIPTSPDYFSLMAIKSLSNVLPQWETWAINARKTFSDAVYPFPQNKPKFLGYTVNNYNIRNGEPANAPQSVMTEIDATINTSLIPQLKKADLLLDLENYGDTFCLGQISNFNSLMQKSQKAGVPVFNLSAEDLGTGGSVLEVEQKSVANFNNTFFGMAKKINTMVGHAISDSAISA
ncbi:MAG: ParA family protein [Cytophagales bacterium]